MNVRKWITGLILKLPDPLLVALSGGAPVVKSGRVLDARFQFIAHAAARQKLPEPMTPEIARWGTDLLVDLFGGRPEPGVACTEMTIALPGRDLAARAYRPDGQRPEAPLFVYYHFGGGVVGNPDTCHAFCGMLARATGCPVLSVAYRLAPEHPWPAGLDDAVDSFLWARENAAAFGAPAGVAAAGGDSMGGNFTAILAQEMKRRGLAQPVLQLLIYPATDINARDGSMQVCADSYPLTADTMAFFMAHYLPAGADPRDPRVSPALEPDLSGLAPAILVTAGHDPLVDQGMAYAAALEAAGVRVEARCEDALAHGFTAYTGAVPAADRACRQIAADCATALRALGH